MGGEGGKSQWGSFGTCHPVGSLPCLKPIPASFVSSTFLSRGRKGGCIALTWWWFELRGAFCEVSFPWDPSDFLSVTAVGCGISAHLMAVAPEGTGDVQVLQRVMAGQVQAPVLACSQKSTAQCFSVAFKKSNFCISPSCT